MNANLLDTMGDLAAEIAALGAVSEASRIGRAVALAAVATSPRPVTAPYDWSPKAAPQWRRVG